MKLAKGKIAFLFFTFLCVSGMKADASFLNNDCCDQASDCGSFGVGGDWLYWKVKQQQMQVASNVIATPNDGGVSIASHVLEPKTKSTSGYRVFGDYVTADKNWRIEAAFTHVPTNASFNYVGDPADIATNFVTFLGPNFPLLTGFAGTPFSSASANWDADVNYFDFDVARRFNVCDSIEIKPHIGIRGLWINQKIRINGINDFVLTSMLKQRLNGIGVEGGLWGSWDVGCGLSVIGHIGGSVVYSRLHSSGNVVSEAETTTSIAFNYHSHLSIPSVDSFIGLAYRTNYCDTTIDLHIGWEHHVFVDVNQFSLTGSGDMSLQGLTLGGSVFF